VQLVMGPAGVGKSSYCKTMQDHCAASGRRLHVANLDPAAENYEYNAAFDVKDLINLEDAMEEFGLGPNGGKTKTKTKTETYIDMCDVQEDVTPTNIYALEEAFACVYV